MFDLPMLKCSSSCSSPPSASLSICGRPCLLLTQPSVDLSSWACLAVGRSLAKHLVLSTVQMTSHFNSPDWMLCDTLFKAADPPKCHVLQAPAPQGAPPLGAHAAAAGESGARATEGPADATVHDSGQETQVGIVLWPRLLRLTLPFLMHNEVTFRSAGAVPPRPQPGCGARRHCILFGPMQRPAAHLLHAHCLVKLSTPKRMVWLSWSHRAGICTRQCYKASV